MKCFPRRGRGDLSIRQEKDVANRSLEKMGEDKGGEKIRTTLSIIHKIPFKLMSMNIKYQGSLGTRRSKNNNNKITHFEREIQLGFYFF